MSTLLQQDFFQLFKLPRQFALDTQALDDAWRTAAAQVHPDRYASASDAEKRSALMLATQVNEAYRTLKSPLHRARYLLQLAGVDTQEESNTQMPVEFLMAQMHWREAIEGASLSRDMKALEKLSSDLGGEAEVLQSELLQALDQHGDLDTASLLVRKCRFLEKLEQEISDGLEDLLM